MTNCEIELELRWEKCIITEISMVIDPIRDFFEEYYLALVETKDFNALIVNKLFSASKKRYEKPIKVLRSNG